MTPTREHISGLELALSALDLDDHQSIVAGLHRLIAQAKSAPMQGEAVEVVGYGTWAQGLPPGTRLMRYDGEPLVHLDPGMGFDIPLMTVAQHNRIMAAAKPDDGIAKSCILGLLLADTSRDDIGLISLSGINQGNYDRACDYVGARSQYTTALNR